MIDDQRYTAVVLKTGYFLLDKVMRNIQFSCSAWFNRKSSIANMAKLHFGCNEKQSFLPDKDTRNIRFSFRA
jgi:hypothetical protein